MSDARQPAISLKKIWYAATPLIQIGGFVILCAFVIGGYFTEFKAQGAEIDKHEERIKELESNYAQINQNLKDIHDYLLPPNYTPH